jgi:hypothetical protein
MRLRQGLEEKGFDPQRGPAARKRDANVASSKRKTATLPN